MDFFEYYTKLVNICMENTNSDVQDVDSKAESVLYCDHSSDGTHGEYRINNAGRLEYYTEGYWQETPWLDRDK